jgi:hypothetical protein
MWTAVRWQHRSGMQRAPHMQQRTRQAGALGHGDGPLVGAVEGDVEDLGAREGGWVGGASASLSARGRGAPCWAPVLEPPPLLTIL